MWRAPWRSVGARALMLLLFPLSSILRLLDSAHARRSSINIIPSIPSRSRSRSRRPPARNGRLLTSVISMLRLVFALTGGKPCFARFPDLLPTSSVPLPSPGSQDLSPPLATGTTCNSSSLDMVLATLGRLGCAAVARPVLLCRLLAPLHACRHLAVPPVFEVQIPDNCRPHRRGALDANLEQRVGAAIHTIQMTILALQKIGIRVQKDLAQ